MARDHSFLGGISRNGPRLRGFGEHGRAKIWPKCSERMRAERGPSPHRIPRGEAWAGCYAKLGQVADNRFETLQIWG